MSDTLGQALDQLLADVAAKAAADPGQSYTAKLLGGGPGLCAKKLGEEGVEMALAVASGSPMEIAQEAADLLYHLGVALLARGVTGAEIAAVLEARRGTSGLEEKAGRTNS
jgi:phosphoribosyl-ATP pyrophosphohydrolase